jgi:hypothetical protein
MRTQLRPFTLALLLVLPLAILVGCAEEPPAPGAVAPDADGPAADTPVPPMTSRGPVESAPGAPAPPAVAAGEGASIQWDLPAGWQASQPASPMRMAQAGIPGPGGPAEMTVFFFGAGGGGGTEANIERWIGQVETTAEPERGSFETAGYQVTWVGVPGTIKASGMGMGPAEPQPGSRLLGAVVEGPGGPWFFKITGPETTVAAAREPFFALLRSVRPG